MEINTGPSHMRGMLSSSASSIFLSVANVGFGLAGGAERTDCEQRKARIENGHIERYLNWIVVTVDDLGIKLAA